MVESSSKQDNEQHGSNVLQFPKSPAEAKKQKEMQEALAKILKYAKSLPRVLE